MRVRTIQRFSMKEEDPYGSWKRLYLKFFGSPRFPWDRKRERERFTSGKLDSMLVRLQFCLDNKYTRQCNFNRTPVRRGTRSG